MNTQEIILALRNLYINYSGISGSMTREEFQSKMLNIQKDFKNYLHETYSSFLTAQEHEDICTAIKMRNDMSYDEVAPLERNYVQYLETLRK